MTVILLPAVAVLVAIELARLTRWLIRPGRYVRPNNRTAAQRAQIVDLGAAVKRSLFRQARQQPANWIPREPVALFRCEQPSQSDYQEDWRGPWDAS